MPPLQDSIPSLLPSLRQRFQSLVWSCLDADLTRTAVFYAERFCAMDQQGHDSRHLYATTLLRAGQPYSAISLVNKPEDIRCGGCLELKAKACTSLGRHRQAQEALEAALKDPNYIPSASTGPRLARPYPEEAALRCRAGVMALKGNLPEQATSRFREALAMNPLLWEAFEGLCSLGSIPEIDELFPPRPPPVKRIPVEEPPSKHIPMASGAGFFTPDISNAGNLLGSWKHDLSQQHPFRIAPPPTVILNEAPYSDNSNHVHRSSRSHALAATTQPPTSRPLSSADEAGPVPKKQRSNNRTEVVRASKSVKMNVEEPLTKARVRTALTFANFFSSSGRRSQPTTSSRATAGVGKSSQQPTNPNVGVRRSTRLLGGAGAKQSHPSKPKPVRGDRRRTHRHSHSIEPEIDEERIHGEDARSPPPSVVHSPRSEASPASSTWTASQEQAAQETYEGELADHYLYDLMRRFASATRALALYDCKTCISELEQLPKIHQKSPWVIAMIGRAHYEQLDYAAAERAFEAVRTLEPYRLWDMEVYSTLLWHLQRNVELSFLAQELLNIDPQSPQAWIAVGNLFSLQKERTQALTCFKRAAQMDSTCAYAYTLSGHESIDEDLDKAIGFFQSALRADPRHYNAWYGLGTCYLRMSKVRLAEYHYRKAVEIHPNNAVLLGCVGMAVERRGDREAALKLFNEAIRLSPENALVRYRRAKMLISMRSYQAAIDDLECLRNTSPEESNVVFQLARAYRLIGNELKSAQTLALARDISPKSLSKIKKLLETVKDEGAEDRMDEG